MSRLGRAELMLGEFVDLDEALRRVALVTADDVQSLASDLAAGPYSLVAVGSADEAEFHAVIDQPAIRSDVA